MIERHVTFHVLPDKKSEFFSFFYDEYLPASDGFLSANLLQVVDSELDLMMIIRFDSFESAANWRGSSKHQDLKPKLKVLNKGSVLQVLEAID